MTSTKDQNKKLKILIILWNNKCNIKNHYSSLQTKLT